jgi:hypothetical protein
VEEEEEEEEEEEAERRALGERSKAGVVGAGRGRSNER